MTRILNAGVAVAVVLMLASNSAWAQRGIGDASGVARQPVPPEIVTLSGTVAEVKTGPCEQTTGRYPVGAHFLLKTSQEDTLNVHLGPANVVEPVAKELPIGRQVEVRAFRTESMQPDHYVAQSIAVGDRVVRLRDDRLRPVWAGGRRMPIWESDSSTAPSDDFGPMFLPGAGRNRAAGWGRGPGRGAPWRR